MPKKVLGKVRWAQVNAKLREAQQVIKNESCGSCGHPVWLGQSIDAMVQFLPEVTTCYSCAEMEKRNDLRSKSKSKHYGETVSVELAEYTGFVRPSRRQWLRQMESKAKSRERRADSEFGLQEEKT